MQEGSMQRRRIVIAGTSSGVGKTSVSLGIMGALKRRGLQVQGFKCGPDYIDPSYHSAITGRASRNLDTWMMSHERMQEVFLRGSQGADLSVIEGVMGLYDGKDPLSNAGSTAEIALLLESPVLLVVDVRSMARSAAAVVAGFKQLEPRLNIAGVIANQCGSESHYRMVKAAVEQECGVPVVGWLGRDDELEIPERHLGLIPALERGELDPLFERLSQWVEKGVDLDRLLALMDGAPSITVPDVSGGILGITRRMHGEKPVLAVARDAAFNFYYAENLEMLAECGAELLMFSPLAGERVPEGADGVYIGGGFPEEFAASLAEHQDARTNLRERIAGGLPVYAECGGYMYLMDALTDREGSRHAMVGSIPGETAMQPRLAALGYREVTALQDCLLLKEGDTLRGHEFHYSKLLETSEGYPYAYQTKGLWASGQEGYAAGHVMGSYTHVHFVSNPAAVERFLGFCLRYRESRGSF